MYKQFQQRLAGHVRKFLRYKYRLEVENIIVEQPPRVELGEFALPLAFDLAKKLRKAPRMIAQEIVVGMDALEGFEKFEVAGAGYINARLDRAAAATAFLTQAPEAGEKRSHDPHAPHGEKILVEHTSINPNKAAHIGHLRNAVLGDTFVRLLRSAGNHVDVQNYIDNTGVQVADVVVGFTHIEKKASAEVAELARQPHFDFYCWDLYAHVSQWYEQDAAHKQVRLDTLHAIEKGDNEVAALAEVIATAILRRHLETMQRLDIEYDFLPRESEILRLHFWDAAFEQMKQKGVLTFQKEGKNKGCWVMRRGGASETAATEAEEKVIVRSNNTVTYVGKDIAYHLWKFGLLGKDFGYQKFYRYPNGHDCWISAETGEAQHPHFGGVSAIYNVIDTRQTDPQNNVVDAIRALGYTDQAEHYTHFSYEMVALTPRCAEELGYAVSDEEKTRAYIEVSGRKGFGVKADDLLDSLIASAQKEVDSRHAERPAEERRAIAEQIAIGALRYFMLKFTKNAVIAFDFKDALSFEGETGPYCQYAVVRASNIFRKADVAPEVFFAAGSLGATPSGMAALLKENDIWEVWLAAGKLGHVVDECIATTEPAYLAKFAFQLAQLFNNFYHRHHILNEPDEKRKAALLATAAVVRRELVRALELMGVSVPPVM